MGRINREHEHNHSYDWSYPSFEQDKKISKRLGIKEKPLGIPKEKRFEFYTEEKSQQNGISLVKKAKK